MFSERFGSSTCSKFLPITSEAWKLTTLGFAGVAFIILPSVLVMAMKVRAEKAAFLVHKSKKKPVSVSSINSMNSFHEGGFGL